MAGVRPKSKRFARRATVLLGGAAFVGVALSAMAQEAELRGAVSETTLNRSLLDEPQTALEQPVATETTTVGAGRRYQPASAGALPDPAGSPTLTERSVAEEEDAAATPEPRPAYTPSTARQRRTTTATNDADENRDATRTASTAPGSAATPTDEVSTGTVQEGVVRQGTVDSELDVRIDPGAEREEAIEGLDRSADENPYEAPGLRFGTFVVRPSLETGIGWTSNANYDQAEEASTYSETTLRFIANSDWSRHRASLEGYGTFRKSFAGADIKDTNAGLSGDLEIELGQTMRALAALDYTRGPEAASSPVVIAGTLSRPLRQTFGGSLGLEKDVGKLFFGVTGEVTADRYGDADLSTGGTLSQRDRNSTLATVALRGGYEISPGLRPFAEVEYGRRFYELDRDSAGYERSANRIGARGGVELDISEKLTGEISGGWLRETPDDARLASISGATVDGDLRWSPIRGTIVSLNAQTFVEGTTTPGETGSILYSTRLGVERQMRANLTGTAGVGLSFRDYTGSPAKERTLFAEAGLTWWLNRYVGVTGRARHERLDSDLPNRDYQVNSVFLGVRLQR
ncbi:MAG: outer membrane beta-barrel protein [Rhizobiaceae bacterium]